MHTASCTWGKAVPFLWGEGETEARARTHTLVSSGQLKSLLSACPGIPMRWANCFLHPFPPPRCPASVSHPHLHGLTNHVLAHVCHRVELLLTDLTGELLLRVAMHYLVVLMQGPELLEGFAAGHALWESRQSFAWGPELALAPTGPVSSPEECGKKADLMLPGQADAFHTYPHGCWAAPASFPS